MAGTFHSSRTGTATASVHTLVLASGSSGDSAQRFTHGAPLSAWCLWVGATGGAMGRTAGPDADQDGNVVRRPQRQRGVVRGRA
ncbi:MAG: hypothetical protein H0V41_13610 [Pseudonocardiales bacterium]|nr:hypothetical protein [Pseudonocardiales bacterium]